MTVGIFEHLRWWLNWWMEGRICWVVGKAESLGEWVKWLMVSYLLEVVS